MAQETNKAFQAVSQEADWAFYIQGDEVVHEKYLQTIYNDMNALKNHKKIDGLLFKYLHFYGSYDYYVGASSNWYDHEIRIIRNDQSIYSYKDAQGFRKADNQKLVVHPIEAYIYHYGWVKPPEAQQRKREYFHKYWHDDDWIEKNVTNTEKFSYHQNIIELRKFIDTHPEVMKQRIAEKNWNFDYDISMNRKTLKYMLKQLLRKTLGLNFDYKNYILYK